MNNVKLFSLSLLFVTVVACGPTNDTEAVSKSFTIAVIPDTQNAIDFSRQQSSGFAIDSADVFIEQMRYLAGKGVAQGGDIVFVASVGDIWQHSTSNYDKEHFDRGVTAIENPYLAINENTYTETLSFEVPKAIEGYQLISDAGIPFGVVPGNHDYDAIWSASAFPPNLEKEESELESTTEDLGTLHLGGLSNFVSAFGSDTDFFRDKSWYLDGFRGGENSAQLFEGGGYKFLHLAFEMQAGDHVLAWAQGIIDKHPGIPTIITTHDYMDKDGVRTHSPILNLAAADPEFNNTSQQLWDKFISKNDQVFMVLCGHNLGQALKVDVNDYGHKVYQIMADYQERGQAGIDAGEPLRENGDSVGIGDGWVREMTFNMEGEHPVIQVKTYSSHYSTYSSDLATYAGWYKTQEQPDMSDAQFFESDDYVIELDDFFARYRH